MKKSCLTNTKNNKGVGRVSLYDQFFINFTRTNNKFGIILHALYFTVTFFSNAAFAQTPGEWTWMHGLTTFDSPGVFGTKGVTNPANMPPALYEPAGEWKDPAGNLYFFGGLGLGYYSDIWKYDVSANQWIWINGPGIPDQLGVYGTQGIPAAANYPGGRAYASVTWVDNAGNFWLFGGTGYNAVSAGNIMNELWKYNVATNQWAWMGGPNNINSSLGSYGAMGVAGPTNLPPARAECSASWVDNSGNLWFYGGNGGINKRFGDMWKYDVSTNQWTWMSGSNAFNAPAVYGTLNVPAAANTPGGRWTYASWTDLTGKFWLFGGTLGSLVTNQNDMWLYDPTINQWTWKGGNANANYGTKCIPAATNLPPKKYENRYRARDACGNFWLFGANNITSRWGNDLWYFNVTTEQWTWISGDDNTVPPAPAVFGTITVSNPANKPGGRYGGTMWADNSGNLWIFAGMGSSSSSWNDLWRFVPPRSFSQSQINVTACSPCNGSATVNFTCALANYNYVWSNGNSILSSSNSTNTISGLCAGTYTVTVTSNCNQAQTAVFNITGSSCGITANINPAAICNGTASCPTLTATSAGGTGPYTYLWSTTATTASISPCPSVTTNYTVTITDSGGLTATSVTVIVVNPTVAINTTIVNLTCSGGSNGSIFANPTSGTSPFTYSWSGASGQTGAMVTGLSEGTYTVTVTDGNGCTATNTSVIGSPSPLAGMFIKGTANCTGCGCKEWILLNATGGTSPYTYAWPDGYTQRYKKQLCPDTYNVNIQDKNGCSIIVSLTAP